MLSDDRLKAAIVDRLWESEYSAFRILFGSRDVLRRRIDTPVLFDDCLRSLTDERGGDDPHRYRAHGSPVHVTPRALAV